jgi:hypothetical protein
MKIKENQDQLRFEQLREKFKFKGADNYTQIDLDRAIQNGKRKNQTRTLEDISIDLFNGNISDVIAYLENLRDKYAGKNISIDIEDSDEDYAECSIMELYNESDEEYIERIQNLREGVEYFTLKKELEEKETFLKLKEKYG